MLPPEGGPTGGDPRYIAEACERSLERLGTDRIDVYLLHRPDADTPIGETLAALNRLREQGKVREFGCSNFTAEQMQEAATAAAGLRGFATVQNMYSLVFREPETEVFPACERLGMSFMPYFPLASGVLTGKYRRGEPAPAGSRLGGSGGEPAEKVIDPNQLVAAERLGAFAEAHGHTLLELALSWLATRRGVATVIAGATSAEQVRANAAATTAWKLSHDQLAELDRLTKGD
jgi:aryl-alcohol dehydrogenase-like predicted oxidoreductase